ncbi:keratin-like protein KRT222 isoform X1 [Stigmatopora argus]
MWGANPGFKGFPERANGLPWANRLPREGDRRHLARNHPTSRPWSEQEDAVEELRAQVGKLLLENAQLALQCESMKSRAAAIESSCEREQRLTRRLEEQVDLLRESKRKNQQRRVILRANVENSVTELRVIHQEYEAARAAQLRRLPSGDALSVVQAEKGGAEMALSRLLDQIRAQGELGQNQRAGGSPGPSPSEAGAGQSGASAELEAASTQVDLGSAALPQARADLLEARGRWRSLRVEMETLRALSPYLPGRPRRQASFSVRPKIRAWACFLTACFPLLFQEKGPESSLRNTQELYSGQLRELCQVIDGLRAELEQVRNGLGAQRRRRARMLHHKTRLEREIAAYRRLLEREEGRYTGPGQWQSSWPLGKSCDKSGQNSFHDEATSDPETTSLLQKDSEPKESATLVLAEPEADENVPIATVRTREVLAGNRVRERAEGRGTVAAEKMDNVIRQWERCTFGGNPKLGRKCVSLRLDLHMAAAADEGCAPAKKDRLPDVELRLVVKTSRGHEPVSQ